MDILDVEGEKIKEALKPDSYIVFVFDEHNGQARHYGAPGVSARKSAVSRLAVASCPDMR